MTVKREELGPEPPRMEHAMAASGYVTVAYADWHRKRADAQAELLRRAREMLLGIRASISPTLGINGTIDAFIAELDKAIS